MAWNDFMFTKDFQTVMTILRVLTFVGIILLIIIMIKEIESVKILGGNACELCRQKTGAICWNPNYSS